MDAVVVDDAGIVGLGTVVHRHSSRRVCGKGIAVGIHNDVVIIVGNVMAEDPVIVKDAVIVVVVVVIVGLGYDDSQRWKKRQRCR